MVSQLDFEASHVLTIGVKSGPLFLTITAITDSAYGGDFQKNADPGNFKGVPRENYEELIWTRSIANVANYL